MSSSLSRSETVYGWIYLFIQLLLLPALLRTGNAMLAVPLSEAGLNFLFFLINFLAVVLIFHRFLHRAVDNFLKSLPLALGTVVLGLGICLVWDLCFGSLIAVLRPQFVNFNDAGITQMARSHFLLMAVGTVILVPPVEECLYRGLLFRNLLEKSRIAAYLLSSVAFTMVHLLGFLGILSPVDLLLSFLQYLPAGLCLAWAFRKSDTICVPIVIHALINLRGIYSMR